MASPAKTLIHGLTQSELAELCLRIGQPRFRSAQLWRWLYVQRASSWVQMTNLPLALREALAAEVSLDAAVETDCRHESDGTEKVLAALSDGDAVETVLIPAVDRRTVCLSTQVGCRFGCAFCASGQAGFRRNLQAGEIVGQVLLAARRWGDRPSNVVFMGIGEPFDNYDAVLRAIRILNDPDGLCIGARRITVSTCGVIPGIERLAGEGLQIELSVSLHAPDDALRSRLMPVNRKYPIRDLLRACFQYTGQTGRIVTFEYTLVRGLNDSVAHADALARLLAGGPGRVNLIPLSPVAEFRGAAPAPQAVRDFAEALERARVNVTLRSSRGAGVNAACGQLRFSCASESVNPDKGQP